jgi:hypothetical protein
MCKDCKCQKNTGKLDKKRYFSAVIDVTTKLCKQGEDPILDESYRYFNQKFVDSPEKALLFAFDSEREAWKTDPAEILKDVVFDPKENEYIRRTILTRDGHIPNEKQKEKIYNGTYEYILMEEFVQVFETNLVGGAAMIPLAIDSWRKHTGKTY